MSTKKLKFVKLFHKLKNFSRQKEITKIFFALRAVKFALIAFQELLKSPFEVFGVIYKESWKKYFFSDLSWGRVCAVEGTVSILTQKYLTLAPYCLQVEIFTPAQCFFIEIFTPDHILLWVRFQCSCIEGFSRFLK